MLGLFLSVAITSSVWWILFCNKVPGKLKLLHLTLEKWLEIFMCLKYSCLPKSFSYSPTKCWVISLLKMYQMSIVCQASFWALYMSKRARFAYCPLINIQIHVNHHVITVVAIMHHLQSLWPPSEVGTGISIWQKKKLRHKAVWAIFDKISKVENNVARIWIHECLKPESLSAVHFPDTSASHWRGGYSAIRPVPWFYQWQLW